MGTVFQSGRTQKVLEFGAQDGCTIMPTYLDCTLKNGQDDKFCYVHFATIFLKSIQRVVLCP